MARTQVWETSLSYRIIVSDSTGDGPVNSHPFIPHTFAHTHQMNVQDRPLISTSHNYILCWSRADCVWSRIARGSMFTQVVLSAATIHPEFLCCHSVSFPALCSTVKKYAHCTGKASRPSSARIIKAIKLPVAVRALSDPGVQNVQTHRL